MLYTYFITKRVYDKLGELGYNPIKGGDDYFEFNEKKASELDWFVGASLAKVEEKVKGRLRREGDELRVLNRMRRTCDGYEREADRRHAKIIIAECRLDKTSRSLSTPARKLSGKEVDAETEPLCASEFPCCRYAGYCLCREGVVSRHVSTDDARQRGSKRLGRYLL